MIIILDKNDKFPIHEHLRTTQKSTLIVQKLDSKTFKVIKGQNLEIGMLLPKEEVLKEIAAL